MTISEKNANASWSLLDGEESLNKFRLAYKLKAFRSVMR
jgi:hypothetical protein